MGGDSGLILAKVKWFGGRNNRTGRQNDFGFAESSLGEDIFIHKKVVDEDPFEDQFVLLTVEKSDRGHSATTCYAKPLKTHLSELLDIIHEDDNGIDSGWKDILRTQISYNIPTEKFISLPADGTVVLMKDIFGVELEPKYEFTPWESGRALGSPCYKLIEILDLLIAEKPVKSIPKPLWEFITDLPVVIIASLKRSSELLAVDTVREKFKEFFKGFDIRDPALANRILQENLANQSLFFNKPKIVKHFIEEAQSDEPGEQATVFYHGLMEYIAKIDFDQLTEFITCYTTLTRDTEFLSTFFPDNRFKLSLSNNEDISAYPYTVLYAKRGIIENYVRDNPGTPQIDQLLDELSPESVIDICFSLDVEYKGLAARSDVSRLLTSYIEDQETENVPPKLAKHLNKLDPENLATVEIFFIDDSIPAVIKKMVGPRLGSSLLYNKSEMANWLYVNGYAGPPNMHNFILFTLLPLLIKNSSDVAYDVFRHKLWVHLEETQLDLDDSLMRLFPSCYSMGPLSCEAVYWEKTRIFLCRGHKCEHPKVIPDMDKPYQEYSIYEWLKHYGIDYLEHDKPRNADFAHRLAGYFNRLKEIADILYCRSCDKLLVPNFSYSRTEYLEFNAKTKQYEKKSMSAAYRVTVFRCENDSCKQHKQDIYINHCIGWNCNEIIDSRDLKIRCSENFFVCGACGSCCEKHLKAYPPGFCPQCGSPLNLFGEYDNRYVYCSSRSCDFHIATDDLPKRFLLDSMPVRRPGESQSNQGYGNARGYANRGSNRQSRNSSGDSYYDDDPGWG
jgi:cold shock CspA family protein